MRNPQPSLPQEPETELDRKIGGLIVKGVGFGVVRVNDEGEHILIPEGDEKEYKFDSKGRLLNP